MKEKFEKRFWKYVGSGSDKLKKVHEQMLEANVGAEMTEVGAIQAPDIVRDELTRVARLAEQAKKRVSMFPEHVRRLGDWALAREQN